MLKLYYVPRSRAHRPRWVLEEIGHPYQLVRLDPSKGETRTPEYLAIQPLGHVPAMSNGDFHMFESCAIALHLAEHFAEGTLMPPSGGRERALVYQWAFFLATELEPPSVTAYAIVRQPEAERDQKALAQARDRYTAAARVVEQALEGKEFLVGGRFTVADILMAAGLIAAERYGLLPDLPNLRAYLTRLRERPAAKRAYAD